MPSIFLIETSQKREFDMINEPHKISVMHQYRLISLRICIYFMTFFFSLTLTCNAQITSLPSIEWSLLPPIPDLEGFAGMFAGIIDGKLIVAGGANFPNGYPWEGGQKNWSNRIFILDSKTSKNWRESKLRLPKSMAYGVSCTFNNRLICSGGETGPNKTLASSKPSCISDVFSIGFKEGQLHLLELPSLPQPIKDACGLRIESRLVIFGGIESPSANKASKEMWILDLENPEKSWIKGLAIPGSGRIQSIAASTMKELIVFGGIEIEKGADSLSLRKMPYLSEVWNYQPGEVFENGKWRRIHDMPIDLAASPGPAWNFSPSQIAIVGGVSSERHRLAQKGHQGWAHDIYLYDMILDKWDVLKNTIPGGNSRVTAPALVWGSDYVVISGEVSPGKRTPQVIRFSTEQGSKH